MQMNDISYEILDLFKKYGADKEGISENPGGRQPPGSSVCPFRYPAQPYGLDGFFRTGKCAAARTLTMA